MSQILIGLILLVVSVIFATIRRQVDARDHTTRSALKAGSFVVTVVGVVTLATCPLTVVSAGQRGVVVTFGTVSDETLTEGIHYVNPLASVKEMSARVEKDEEHNNAETRDTQSVTITTITNWKPVPEKLGWLYKNYGEDYAHKIIPPAMREVVKAEIAKYKVTEIIEKRPEIHKAVQEAANAWLNRYGMEVLEIAIAEIDFSDKYDQAIEAKQVQEQQALQKKYELEKTVTEAQMAAAVAKGEADSRIARAEGDAKSVTLSATAEAEALRIRGEAQADYNRRIAESMNPLLLQSEYLKKWDGKLPVYSLGEGGQPNFLIGIPDQKK